jgi:hypothetical protein
VCEPGDADRVRLSKLTLAAPEESVPALDTAADSDPDSPASTESFAGDVHDRTTRNADGSGETTMLSSPRMRNDTVDRKLKPPELAIGSLRHYTPWACRITEQGGPVAVAGRRYDAA